MSGLKRVFRSRYQLSSNNLKSYFRKFGFRSEHKKKNTKDFFTILKVFEAGVNIFHHKFS